MTAEAVESTYRFKNKSGQWVWLKSKFLGFRNPYTQQLDYIVGQNFLVSRYRAVADRQTYTQTHRQTDRQTDPRCYASNCTIFLVFSSSFFFVSKSCLRLRTVLSFLSFVCLVLFSVSFTILVNVMILIKFGENLLFTSISNSALTVADGF